VDNKTPHRIGVFIYDDAEVLDFSGPFEVFSTACRLLEPHHNPLEILLIAESEAPVLARGGFQVVPHFSIENHPPVDSLVIVGGVHSEVMYRSNVLHWLRAQSSLVKNLASVCTGAFLLAEAGLIDQLSVTTHWQDQADLQQQYPTLKVVAGKRWVEAEAALRAPRIITSGGISAGIDMSLFLLSKITDKDLAVKTARQMEFDWRR